MQTAIAGYYDGTNVVLKNPVDIPRGEKVVVMVADELSSNKNKIGDDFFGALHFE